MPALSIGGCTSVVTGTSESASTAGDWQKDVVSLCVRDCPSSSTTSQVGSTFSSIWCNEWCWPDGSGPGLTARFYYTESNRVTEEKYVGCSWGITKSLEKLEDPGEGWQSGDFYEISIPEIGDYYFRNRLTNNNGQYQLSSIWYKEWNWHEAGARCLTVRYKGTYYYDKPIIYETKYVGCRYIISNIQEPASESTSSETNG